MARQWATTENCQRICVELVLLYRCCISFEVAGERLYFHSDCVMEMKQNNVLVFEKVIAWLARLFIARVMILIA